MLVNVYNKSGISITIDNTIIEEGVNSIPAIQWNAISRNKSILDLIKNCDLLVECYEEYVSYKEALNFFNDDLLNAIEKCKESKNLQALEGMLTQAQANLITLEVFAENFAGDKETKEIYISLDTSKYMQEIEKARDFILKAQLKQEAKQREQAEKEINEAESKK